MPHPSLSLTWIFSLILSPLFFYRLLRNRLVGKNVAVALVSFYLVTPCVLSYETMLFRPAKAMANFVIIFCLYRASVLVRNSIEKKTQVSLGTFISFLIVTALLVFFDETTLFVIPGIVFLFPRLLRRRSHFLAFFLLPVLVLFGYYFLIPQLSSWAGHGFPHLNKCSDIQGFLMLPANLLEPFKYFASNASHLIFDTIGLMIPASQAPVLVKIMLIGSLICWIILFYYILRARNKEGLLVVFLGVQLLVFNHSMSAMGSKTWGPFWYGTFWSVFFVFFLARLIEKANIPKPVLTVCLFIILINMSNCFLATNLIYKNWHYYPYNPGKISLYFQDRKLRFDPEDKPFLSGADLKLIIYDYWIRVKQGETVEDFTIPRELCWLPLEVEPEETHTRYSLLDTNNINYFKTN
ncbi:MAG: hypothetical protein HQL22_12145 [Candidatus Omnitrophica bacterium]|nr:hypothetical protein [Candidatus Omnitrophota bacterium]